MKQSELEPLGCVFGQDTLLSPASAYMPLFKSELSGKPGRKGGESPVMV